LNRLLGRSGGQTRRIRHRLRLEQQPVPRPLCLRRSGVSSPLTALVVFGVWGGVCFEAEFADDDGVLDGGVFDQLGDFADVGEDGGAGEVGEGWEGVVLMGVEDEGRGFCGWVGGVGEGIVGGPVGGAPEGVFRVSVGSFDGREGERLAVNRYVDAVGFRKSDYFCAIGVEVLKA